jgi:hypothetical protein
MHGFRTRCFAPIVAALGLLVLALVPAVVGAQSQYPPGTVVSSYFDARFCGNGQVSVVADQSGNLVDVCTATGQRIDSGAYAVPGYSYGYAPGYGTGVGAPVYGAGLVPPVYGAAGNAPVIRQYTDTNSNCPNGDVTQTAAGFYCTVDGQPAVSNSSISPYYGNGYAPVYSGGYLPGLSNGYAPVFNGNVPYSTGYAGNGVVTRQYTDDRSNCPNGDVTETPSGFYCTANGQPAFRAS